MFHIYSISVDEWIAAPPPLPYNSRDDFLYHKRNHVGPHATKNLPCIGLELTTPNGKSNGVVGAHQYCFSEVEANCFTVVNPARVQFVSADAPKEVDSAKRKATTGAPANKKAKTGPCKDCNAAGHATKRSKDCAKFTKHKRNAKCGMSM
jgi:hypothetical protein